MSYWRILELTDRTRGTDIGAFSKKKIGPEPMQQHGQLSNIRGTRDKNVAEITVGADEAGNSMEEMDVSSVLLKPPEALQRHSFVLAALEIQEWAIPRNRSKVQEFWRK